jgi:hypothetical protein
MKRCRQRETESIHWLQQQNTFSVNESWFSDSQHFWWKERGNMKGQLLDVRRKQRPGQLNESWRHCTLLSSLNHISCLSVAVFLLSRMMKCTNHRTHTICPSSQRISLSM